MRPAWIDCGRLPRDGRQPAAVRPLSVDGCAAEPRDDDAHLRLFRDRRGRTLSRSRTVERLDRPPKLAGRLAQPARRRTDRSAHLFGTADAERSHPASIRPTSPSRARPTSSCAPITSMRTEGERMTFRRMTGLAETRGSHVVLLHGRPRGRRDRAPQLVLFHRRSTGAVRRSRPFMSVQWGSLLANRCCAAML